MTAAGQRGRCDAVFRDGSGAAGMGQRRGARVGPAVADPVKHRVPPLARRTSSAAVRKLAEGKTRKEALRALKRRISDAVYRQLLNDAHR